MQKIGAKLDSTTGCETFCVSNLCGTGSVIPGPISQIMATNNWKFHMSNENKLLMNTLITFFTRWAKYPTSRIQEMFILAHSLQQVSQLAAFKEGQRSMAQESCSKHGNQGVEKE